MLKCCLILDQCSIVNAYLLSLTYRILKMSLFRKKNNKKVRLKVKKWLMIKEHVIEVGKNILRNKILW
jgi:hypothetical protein